MDGAVGAVIDGVRLDAAGVHWPVSRFAPALSVPWTRVLGGMPKSVVYLDEQDRRRTRVASPAVRRAVNAAVERRLLEEVAREGRLLRTWRRRGRELASLWPSLAASLGLPMAFAAVVAWKWRKIAEAGATGWPLTLGGASAVAFAGALAVHHWRWWRELRWTGIRMDAGGLSLRDEAGRWTCPQPEPGDRVGPTGGRWGGTPFCVHPASALGLLGGVPEILLHALARRHAVPLDGRASVLSAPAVRAVLLWAPLSGWATWTWAVTSELPAHVARGTTLLVAGTWLVAGLLLGAAALLDGKHRARRRALAGEVALRLGWTAGGAVGQRGAERYSVK